MFTVKFGSGKTLRATGVSEDYNPRTSIAEKQYHLNIDTDADMAIDDIVLLLNEKNALDNITVVSDDSENEMVFTGYDTINSVYKRLVNVSVWQTTIVLAK